MLKIKDNIDLKDLEKFDFIYYEKLGTYRYICNYEKIKELKKNHKDYWESEDISYIEIGLDRRIRMYHQCKASEEDYLTSRYVEGDMDILYNLFKAKYIQKEDYNGKI